MSEPTGVFDGLNARAIARGVTIDIASTLVLSLIAAVMFAGTDVLSTDSETALAALRSLEDRVGYDATVFATGVFATVLGAFFGARLAGVEFVRHGGWIAVSTHMVMAVMALACPSSEGTTARPLWLELLSWIAIIPAGVLGGWLAGRDRSSDPV